MGKPQFIRIRQKWKAIRLNMSDDPDAPIELYNLEEDIGEMNNIAADYPEIVRKCSEIMKQAHERSPDFPFRYERRSELKIE